MGHRVSWIAKIGAAIAVTLSIGAGCGSAHAQIADPSDPFHRNLVTDCDRLAGIPTDTRRAHSAAGVAFNKIDVGRAQTACDEAIQQYPEVSRFVMLAGRVADAGKDFASSHRLFAKAIDMGNLQAMVQLGIRYDTGAGVAQDDVQARGWYEKAAAAADPVAAFQLGNFYREGRGGPQDFAAARRVYEQSAALGSAHAMTQLGYMTLNGLGAPKDAAEARRWYLKSAQGGEVVGMTSVASMAEKGIGGPQDLGEARHWYEIAADRGNLGSMYNLGVYYANGAGVAKDYAEARRWFEKADAGGFAQAKAALITLTRRASP